MFITVPLLASPVKAGLYYYAEDEESYSKAFQLYISQTTLNLLNIQRHQHIRLGSEEAHLMVFKA